MTILDLTILSFLGYNTFSGFKQGAIKMMSGLIGIGLGTLLSKPIYNVLFFPMSETFPILNKYPLIFYIVCFIGILLSCYFLAIALHQVVNITGLGVFNTFIGVALGFLRGGILCLFIIIPIIIIKPNLIEQSIIIKDLKPVLEIVTNYLLNTEFFQSLFKSYNEIKSTIKQ
tara:strand:- start:450 stop:965 length:516 start_codon:yes stop_codon:yes gene_type:complete